MRRLLGALPPSAVLEYWPKTPGQPDWFVVVEWSEGLPASELLDAVDPIPGEWTYRSRSRLELSGDGWLIELDRIMPPPSPAESLQTLLGSHSCPVPGSSREDIAAGLGRTRAPLLHSKPSAEDLERAATMLAALAADPSDFWGSLDETYCRLGHFDGLLALDSMLPASP